MRLPALGAAITVCGIQVEWYAFRTHCVPTARHHVGEFRQADGAAIVGGYLRRLREKRDTLRALVLQWCQPLDEGAGAEAKAVG